MNTANTASPTGISMDSSRLTKMSLTTGSMSQALAAVAAAISAMQASAAKNQRA